MSVTGDGRVSMAVKMAAEIQNVYFTSYLLLPPANEVWGKVIFSEACVKNSLHRGRCYPSMHCRWYPSMPCRFQGPHPRGKFRGIWLGGLQAWVLLRRDRDRDILTRLRLGHQRPLNRRCPDEKYQYVNNNRLTEYPGTPAWTPATSKSRVSNERKKSYFFQFFNLFAK